MINLLPFHIQASNAWKLFLHRWGSAVALQVLTLIPGVLMYPLVSEYLTALENGIDPAVVFQTSLYAPQFVLGFVLLILLGVFITSSTGILFAAPEKLSFWTVVRFTIARYIPVLYTSILAGCAVVISLVPALALNYWYTIFASQGATITGSAIAAVDTIVLIAIFALLIPPAIVAIWVMYAPLATALKASPAGITSIMFAKHLVKAHVWQLFWRMVGATILFQVVSISVGSLPYASYLVPFVLTILALAFFVEIYKELGQDESYTGR